MVELLISSGARINSRNPHGTPLSAAAGADRIDVMRLLIEKGADIEGKDTAMAWTPLMSAAEKGSIEAVRLLLENGANPNFRYYMGTTPTKIAERNGHGVVAELLRNK